jgi:hypothetical protein
MTAFDDLKPSLSPQEGSVDVVGTCSGLLYHPLYMGAIRQVSNCEVETLPSKHGTTVWLLNFSHHPCDGSC